MSLKPKIKYEVQWFGKDGEWSATISGSIPADKLVLRLGEVVASAVKKADVDGFSKLTITLGEASR